MKQKCRFFLVLLLIACLMMTNSMAAEADPAMIADTDFESNLEAADAKPAPQFQVNAKAGVLIEAETGNVLYALNENEPLPIASITKIMTMLLVMEAVDSGKISLNDAVTISAYATKMGGSQVYLKEGEIFTVEELLKAVAVHSANDAAVALAETVAGSEESFVALMNEKATELKMKNTKFLDATGLTDEGHFSSAMDIAAMSRELLTKHPKIVIYTTIWHDSFRDGKFDLDNTNKLVRRYKGITGIKTGFTNKAGFCLSASAERDGTKLISVVLGSESNDARFTESARLLDFGFANYETARIEKKGQSAGTIMVKKGVIANVPLTYAENATVLIKRGKKAEIVENIVLPDNINAPVQAGQTVGVLNVELNGERLASIPITAANDSMRCTFGLAAGMLIKRWSQLFCSCAAVSSENAPKENAPKENAPENQSPNNNAPINTAPGENAPNIQAPTATPGKAPGKTPPASSAPTKAPGKTNPKTTPPD